MRLRICLSQIILTYKCHAVHYQKMDARGELLSGKEAPESPEAIAEGESDFLSGKQSPQCIHDSIVYHVTFVIFVL